MAASLVSSISLTANVTDNGEIDLQTILSKLQETYLVSLANGTGANQANVLWSDTVTLAASATEDIDLAGDLTHITGKTITFTKIKAIIIAARAANTNNVEVTRPAANGFLLFLGASDGIAIKPGGFICVAAPDVNGYPVTASTGDLLTFTNSAGGTGVTYDVIVIGVGTLA